MEKIVYLRCYFNGSKICYDVKTVNAIKHLSGGYNISGISSLLFNMQYLKKSSFNKIWNTTNNHFIVSCVWCKKSDVNTYKPKLLDSLKKDKNKIKKSIEAKEKEFIDYKDKAEKLLIILNKK